MPMYGYFARLRRDRDGITAVELALMLPVLMLAMVGAIEVGRIFYQAHMIERGLRAGALYAARTNFPLSAADTATMTNLVKTGNAAGILPYTASGWGEPGADLDVVFDNFVVGTDNVPIIRLTANVPFDPLLPGLLNVAGFDTYVMRLTHEQAYIGD